MASLPRDWRTIVYDKSEGGPRQGVVAKWYKSPDGPDHAPALEGAIRLPNIGAEAHTYMHHAAVTWEALDDVTVFMQGDPRQYVSDIPSEFGAIVAMAAEKGFAAVGPFLDCDENGGPHHEEPLVELHEMWAHFRGTKIPPRLSWYASAQFAVRKDVLQRISRATWAAARDICTTKLHACAMERLWWELLGRTARVR